MADPWGREVGMQLGRWEGGREGGRKRGRSIFVWLSEYREFQRSATRILVGGLVVRRSRRRGGMGRGAAMLY